ncbi:alanine--tRNA ligase [Candidatus Woesearchaeota archaeon]|nr:alanine--tRNA ligase [Candidatus Woesearchaeota archaeon]
MPTDKDIKKDFKAKASKNPEQYYATSVLKEEGFHRGKCGKCGTFYWTVNAGQKVCGDPSCSGGFRFIGNTPATKKLDYIEVWKEFSRLFKKWGYTPIKRYPVVARWREDTDFVQASIYDFQPYVVSGEVDPPANPLVVPQTCLRFNDIDNIGITGAHYSCFVMIGQHAFMPPDKWDQAKYFRDIHNWLKEGLGLKNEEITFHEDAWAGGGNFGPCMEYFSRGLELGNQVYMMYEVTPSGSKELKLKVLDMGMGHERNAWFSQGMSTSYETTFPSVMKHLYKTTGFRANPELMQKFLPYASYLNIDEVEDIDKAWKDVAKKVGVPVAELREYIMPSAALYSIAEHSRALLVALSDGALPSNVGGGYNLRVLYRRAVSLIDKYNWNIDLKELSSIHAEYLKPLFPELLENLEQVHTILDVEAQKYAATKEKTKQVVAQIAKQDVNERKLLELYDSQGITPELVREEAEKLGKRIEVPENFYAKVAELHEKQEQEHATGKKEKLELEGLPETKALYFSDYKKVEFTAKVVKVLDAKVLLDQTYFYPTSGGQLHDTGEINGEKVIDVFKQGSHVVHVMADKPGFKAGDTVHGKIDWERRKQLSQHHTATHIMTYAARTVLGKHANQASAKKTMEKGQLDVTHYASITEQQLKEMEKVANEVARKKVPISLSFMPRNEAEQEFSMGIYQGGVVPGKLIRIVNIKGYDVEACGGTHLHDTSEVGKIKVLKATKVSDGIVRVTYTAGKAAEQTQSGEKGVLEETARILGCETMQIPGRLEELFRLWKDVVKKGKKIPFKLSSTVEYKGDVLAKAAEILRTQKEHVPKTAQRFIREIKEKLKD